MGYLEEAHYILKEKTKGSIGKIVLVRKEKEENIVFKDPRLPIMSLGRFLQ